MSLKTAFIASAIWTVLIVVGAGIGIWYISTHPIPGVRNDARTAQLGGGFGVLASIGYGCIWLPYAAKIGKQKRAAREKAKKSQKRR